jgi:hypothetical protein
VNDTELIDEMKVHLPIPAYASRDLSILLVKNGMDITPERELKIIKVAESGEEGGIACFLDIPEKFVVSLTLLRVKPDHSLHDKISAYQKKRIRSIFRAKGLSPRRL